MGRNVHGGSGHKKFARKNNTVPNHSNNSIRVSENELEIYAIATKMLGNKMFHCHCLDNKLRLCHIRGRFDGKNKRNNLVAPGTWLLIGLREWENSSDPKKVQQCDLLEIYSGSSKERLKDIENCDWSILNAHDVSKIATNVPADSDNDFKFETDRDVEVSRLTEEMQSNTAKKITFREDERKCSGDDDDNDEINIDDI